MTDTVNVIDYLTRPERFRTQTRLAEAVGVTQSTIAGRRKTNSLSHEQMRRILTVAPDLGIEIKPEDFFPERAA